MEQESGLLDLVQSKHDIVQSSREVTALAEHLLKAIKSQGLIGVTPEGPYKPDAYRY